MSGIAPVNVTKRTNIVIDQIQNLIIQGALRAGDKLPSERKLATQLGISRATIREAISKLDSQGIVKIRHGTSTIICDIFKEPISNPLETIISHSDKLTSDITAVRHLLEVEATKLAAKNRTVSDLEVIGNAYNKLYYASTSKNLETHAKADSEFHLAIADASHNLILAQIIRSISDLVAQDILKTVTIFSKIKDWQKIIIQQHSDIQQAIINGDETQAEQAANYHLEFVRNI